MSRVEIHFEGKVHQNAIITTKERKNVLIVRDPKDVELWELPGGRLNLGEEPIEGLRREIREELGIEVEVETIYHTQYLWHEREQRQNLLLMYITYILSEDTVLHPDPEEIAEVKWVNKETYVNVPMYKDTRQSLEAFFKL